MGRGGRRAGRAQRLRAGARGGLGAGAPRPRPRADPAPWPARDLGARRGPLVGATRTPAGAGSRATPSSPRPSSTPSAGFPAWDGPGRRRSSGRPRPSAARPWSDGFRSVWQPGGRACEPGEVVRLPALAATLRTLADEGFDAYYDGALGERIARGPGGGRRAVRARRPRGPTGREWTTPIETAYRGVRVTTHPPNSSGADRARDPQRPRPVRAARRRPLRRPRLVRRRPGSTASSRPPSSPSPIETPTSPTRRSATSRSNGSSARTTPPGWRRASTRIAPTPLRRRPARSSAARSTSPSSTPTATPSASSSRTPRASGRASSIPIPASISRTAASSFSLDPASPNVLEPGKRPAHTLLPGMLFREGERAAVGRRRVDGRRHPAADPRPARVGAGRRGRRHRDGRRGAAGRRRAGGPRSAGGGGHRRRARARASRRA